MEAQNTKERKKVTFRFSVLFIACILLVAIPLYFTIGLPGKESKQTSEELQILQEKSDFQKDFFAVRMDSVKHLMDSYDSDGVDRDKLNADIGFLLSEMANSIAGDTSWRFNMYENIIDSYLSIKSSKNELMKVTAELAKCKSSKRPGPNKPIDSLDPE